MWNPLRLFQRRSPPTVPAVAAGSVTLPHPTSTPPLVIGTRLSDAERNKVVQLLAQFWTVGQVQAYVQEQFHKRLSYEGVEQYRSSPRWATLFAQARKEYLARITEVAIANKRVRLERLESMYQAASTDPALQKQPSRLRMELRATLREARGETELGRGTGDTTIAVTQINMLSNEELEQRRKDLLERLKAQEIVDAE